MLCLNFKENESVMIGDDIKVTVLERRPNHGGIVVRLGIEAPNDVVILREKLYKKDYEIDDEKS